jgi:hypothetical protein
MLSIAFVTSELLGCSFGEAIIVHLPLADHMHQFDAGQDDASTPEILETHHWFDDAFDGPVILLHDVIQVLVLANLDQCRALGVERFERGQIGAALIHGNRFGLTVLVNRLLEVAVRSGLVTMGAQQEFNRVALLVDGAVQVLLLAFDLEVGFVQPLALANRSLVPSKRLFEQRHELDDPAVHTRMIHLNVPFDHGPGTAGY